MIQPRDPTEDVRSDHSSLTVASPESPSPPVSSAELAALLLLIVLSDLTIYRGQGFAGYALLYTVGPLLIVLGAARRFSTRRTAIVAALLAVAAVKLVWCGSLLLVLCGAALLFAFAMSLAGYLPFVLETAVFASQTIRAGYDGLQLYGERLRQRGALSQRTGWLSVGLPLTAAGVFGAIFVFANPALVTMFSTRLRSVFDSIREWLAGFSAWEIVFWCASLWIAVGLLRPAALRIADESTVPPDRERAKAPLYTPFRNTLMTVIALFAAYLIFEFRTLWFRQFPEGFYYSGYAHQGAAWLTLALALATLLLSLIFRGRMLADPRLSSLQPLAWLWSLENALLAITVYHRLGIYIGFNGMTRMRVVGLLGITCVVVGFALVVWKITYQKRFVWLLRRQLWTVAAAVYVYAILPVDMLVHRYNVARILGGDPAPSVQISVHPITTDGYLVLPPLLQSDIEPIREGVRALLAKELARTERTAREETAAHWTAWQLADHVLRDRLTAIESQLATSRGNEALERFHEYSYQWY